MPIPGVGNTPAAAPETVKVPGPAPIPDVPRPEGAKVQIAESQKDETKKTEKGSGSGSGGGGAVPGTSQNSEDASGTDTAKQIDELMKKQKELTSKKKLDDADRQKLAK